MPNISNVVIEDAQLIMPFRNFRGAEGRYNREGDRSFSVKLDEQLARDMMQDGWNVKYLRARDEEDDEQPYIQVSVKYNYIPPKIVVISSNGRMDLDEDTVGELDYMEFKNVDLVIRAYEYEFQGKDLIKGVKAQLKSMYVTLDEDELERKYAERDI